MTDHTRRFTGRVESYARHRPSYPTAVLELLERECGLASDSVVADVGSGTGILSILFLQNGNRVFGVEPNAEMRAAAEDLLGDRPRFTSVAGTAEDTTLEAGSVDFAVAGQAFHWFDAGRARDEFARILRPDGRAALIWNLRRKDATPFLAAYERLLQAYRTDRGRSRSGARTEQWPTPSSAPAPSRGRPSTTNRSSTSMASREDSSPSPTSPPGASQAPGPCSGAMLREAERIFDEHQTGGTVTIEYDTEVYYGRLRREK